MGGRVQAKVVKSPVLLKSVQQPIEKQITVDEVPINQILEVKAPERLQMPSVIPEPTPEPIPSPVAQVVAEPAPIIPPEAKATNGTIRILSPSKNAKLFVPNDSSQPQVKVTFKWQVRPAGQPAVLEIVRLGSASSGPPYRSENILSEKETGEIPILFDRPGAYEWRLKPQEGSAFAAETHSGRFEIGDRFQGIKLFDPLIAGEATASNVYSGSLKREFDITFHWEPYPTANQYLIRFFKSAADQIPTLEEKLSESKYISQKKRAFTGQVVYEVETTLPSGFKVKSRRVPFRFDFLPPIPVLPANQTVLNAEAIASNGNRILFTWQKTNFTEVYEIEFSKEKNFYKPFKKKQLKENFLLEEVFPPGSYYWRIKSITQGVTSPPSQPSLFEVRP